MKIPWWVWALGLGGVAYVIYKASTAVSSTVNSATSALAQGIANIWLSLPVIGMGPGVTVLGNARLPDGTLVPMESLVGKLRQSADESAVFAPINGIIYQLAPSDAQGNYPATPLAPVPAGG